MTKKREVLANDHCYLGHPVKSQGKCPMCFAVRAPERFWTYVDKTSERIGGCWIWEGGMKRGYGSFHLGSGEYVYAHIYAYQLMVGPVPQGKELAHACHVKLCVRSHEDHCRPLTHAENMAEKRLNPYR